MLNAKLLLSGVYDTSKVVAPIPLLSIHVASDLDPITLTAFAVCIRERARKVSIKRVEEKTLGVRFGREKRMVLLQYVEGKGEGEGV